MKYGYDEALNFIYNGFVNIGCRSDVAKNITESLLLAEACGVCSHGLRMLSAHAKKIRHHEYNIDADIDIEFHTPSITKVNSNNQIGMYSANVCMQIAIKKAKENGMHTVMANHANTFNAAFVYTLQAVRQGMIGFCMSNSPAQMAPIGGCDKLLGTNPLSYAIPAFDENPIIFDMATSIVAKSKINQAKDKGMLIPAGWVQDINGLPTTNPFDAVKGLVLPMAGAKGYGLALMIDILSGVLSKAQYLDGVGRFYDEENTGMNVGQTFIAIDPNIIYGMDFYKNMDLYISKIKNSRAIEGEIVRLPGEKKFEFLRKSLQEGIDFPDTIIKEFKSIVYE